MAVELERLIVTLEARLGEYNRNLQQARQQTNQQLGGVEKRFDQTTARMGKSAAEASGKMRAGFQGAASAATLIHGPLSGIGSRMTAISAVISRSNVVMASFALGLGSATLAAYKALAAFQEFETQSLVLEQVLRATGGASGKTAKDIEDLAQSIAAATLASTQGVRQAAATLLTFRTVSGDTFDRTLRLAQDLAAVGFGSVETAAIQLGKALENPVEGLAALRRVGVSFSEAQKLVITRLIETGRAAEAQSKVLDAIEMQVGGAGASAAGGLAGAYDTLAQSTDNLLVSWGKQIAEAIDLRAKILGVASALDILNRATGGAAAPSQERLDAVNARIAQLQSRTPATGIMGRSQNSAAERELNELLAERMVLRAQLLSLEVEEAVARKQGIEAQKQIERERAEGVVAGLEHELSLAGKTAIEKRKIVELGKAGVAAETAYGKQITRNIEAIAAADLALKHLTATQTALANARAEADVIGRSDLDAARRLEIQRRLNEATALGIPITKELVAAIEAEAAAIAKAETELQNLRRAYEEVASESKATLSTFIKDMKDGASATEALGNALDKIADKLIDMAVNDLVEVALGGLTGRGGNASQGGLASALGTLFGFKDGGIAKNGQPQPLPRFAGGGVSKSAAIFGEAGPEAAVPLPDGRRIPVDLRMPSANAAGGGAVSVTVAPVFHLEGASPAAVDKTQQEMVPRLKELVRSEVANVFDRKARFSRSGI